MNRGKGPLLRPADEKKATGLTPKQRRFCEEYLVDFSASAAALRAGYSAASNRWSAWNLLGKPEVQEHIQKLRERQTERTEVTADRVVEELARIAFANIGEFADFDGKHFTIKPFAEITEAQKAAISEFYEVINQSGQSFRIKFHDKVAALEKLGKRFGLFKDQIEVSGKDGAPLAVQIYLPNNGR